jgi:dynein light chain roadblock-type
MSSEVEETLKRIQSHRGVKGVLILNQEGIPIRSNLNQEDTDTYAALISQLNFKVMSVVMMIWANASRLAYTKRKQLLR